MTMHEYFAERGFEYTPELKDVDAYEQPIPIGYTTGCTRHLVKALSKPEIKIQPDFGHIYALPQYELATQRMMNTYQLFLAHDLLQNVFGKEAPPIKTEKDFDQIPMEVVHEILTRFYPSDYNWLHDNDGAWPNESGYVDPIEHSWAVNLMLYDTEARKRALHIDASAINQSK